jgi:serine/threonine-protein kinase
MTNCEMRYAGAQRASRKVDKDPSRPHHEVCVSSRAPGLSFGRYLLGERLGVGGMGEVYLAVQQGIGSFEKPLALKLLLPHLSTRERAVRMFLDEARLAARMNHPNVTTIFDVGVVNGRYFMAMELVQGVSLARLIDALKAAGTPPSVELVCAVGVALCEGLHHAHEQKGADGQPLGLVHRDVTPHNILISTDGVVKLADFGIARVQGTLDDTAQPRFLGKLAYLPPEQLRDEPVDRRADLYALGLTLLHFATLNQPFEHPTREATVHAILYEEAVLDAVPEPLRAALRTALAKQPEARPATARALRALLPTLSADATAALGARVSGAFPEELRTLSARTNHALALGRSTDALPGAVTPPRDALVTLDAPSAAPRASKRHRGWLVAGALTVLAGALALGWLRPPVAPVALKAAPSGLGYLTIDAEPWATVTLEGKVIGETPLSSVPVESGTLRVELRNPETGKHLEKLVHVAPGERVYVRETLR